MTNDSLIWVSCQLNYKTLYCLSINVTGWTIYNIKKENKTIVKNNIEKPYKPKKSDKPLKKWKLYETKKVNIILH